MNPSLPAQSAERGFQAPISGKISPVAIDSGQEHATGTWPPRWGPLHLFASGRR